MHGDSLKIDFRSCPRKRGRFSVFSSCYSAMVMLQPLRLEIKRKLAQRSERVKCVDLHPSEPWMLASLHSGTGCIWNYQTQGNAYDHLLHSKIRVLCFIAIASDMLY